MHARPIRSSLGPDPKGSAPVCTGPKCSMNCSSRLATLAKLDEHFNKHFAMKRRQRRSKQIKYAHSFGFAGFMRKMEMKRIDHGLIENGISPDQILISELLNS